MTPLKLRNTLTRQTGEFKPLKNKKVGLYACGPTVYDYAHIGNLRAYICWDILRRVLKMDGYKVKYVMNITDVGHLTSEDENGLDKMEKGAEREKKSAWEIAEFYTDAFKKDIAALHIAEPDIWCRATEHIKEQIKLIKKLEKKGFTYRTTDGIYFDTAKLNDYGKLAGLLKQKLRGGTRVGLGGKKSITDFALWKFSPKLKKRQMEWESPWGVGFPGWHIECSAMSVKYLGQPFDIHCGGIDHIPVHHTNEIAQSEAAEGKPLANWWLHNEFLVLTGGPASSAGGEKMSKSKNNFFTLRSLIERDLPPLAYRYFILQTHYRKQIAFSWEALAAAKTGLEHLYAAARRLKQEKNGKNEDGATADKFYAALNNDLDTPRAMAILWTALKTGRLSLKTLIKFDDALGLGIKAALEKKSEEITATAHTLAAERDLARKNKDWKKSDELRDRLVALGYKVEDGPAGTKINKK